MGPPFSSSSKGRRTPASDHGSPFPLTLPTNSIRRSIRARTTTRIPRSSGFVAPRRLSPTPISHRFQAIAACVPLENLDHGTFQSRFQQISCHRAHAKRCIVCNESEPRGAPLSQCGGDVRSVICGMRVIWCYRQTSFDSKVELVLLSVGWRRVPSGRPSLLEDKLAQFTPPVPRRILPRCSCSSSSLHPPTPTIGSFTLTLDNEAFSAPSSHCRVLSALRAMIWS